MTTEILITAAAFLAGASLAWAQPAETGASPTESREEQKLTWDRIELKTDGGPLPFVVEAPATPERDADGLVYSASIVNGPERIPVRVRAQEGGYEGPGEALIEFLHYDSWIQTAGADVGRTSGSLSHHLGPGLWKKKRGEKYATVEVNSKPVSSAHDRFDPIEGAGEAADLTGRWRVSFSSSEDDAVGEFKIDTETGLATGTFLTTTGDYRFLEGRVDGGLLRLSVFDGAHAFLFKANVQADGSLKGNFWSGNWWHETWTAVRDDDAVLADAMEETTWQGDTELEELVFKNLDAQPTSVAQALDALDDDGGRATIMLVFGSWCPNCADATDYLVELQRTYADRGLRVLGVAFEITGDIERDAKQVRIHQEHHGADWPVLIAGLSDKKEASKAFPVLDRIRSYPTAVFLNRAREPVGVWTGFSGPATGDAYDDLRERWVRLIEELLDG